MREILLHVEKIKPPGELNINTRTRFLALLHVYVLTSLGRRYYFKYYSPICTHTQLTRRRRPLFLVFFFKRRAHIQIEKGEEKQKNKFRWFEMNNKKCVWTDVVNTFKIYSL